MYEEDKILLIEKSFDEFKIKLKNENNEILNTFQNKSLFDAK